eukprot:2301873-Rhodomonas_salina.1
MAVCCGCDVHVLVRGPVCRVGCYGQRSACTRVSGEHGAHRAWSRGLGGTGADADAFCGRCQVHVMVGQKLYEGEIEDEDWEGVGFEEEEQVQEEAAVKKEAKEEEESEEGSEEEEDKGGERGEGGPAWCVDCEREFKTAHALLTHRSMMHLEVSCTGRADARCTLHAAGDHGAWTRSCGAARADAARALHAETRVTFVEHSPAHRTWRMARPLPNTRSQSDVHTRVSHCAHARV